MKKIAKNIEQSLPIIQNIETSNVLDYISEDNIIKNIQIWNNEEDVFLRLPILNNDPDNLKHLSLFDKVIFSTILAWNFQGKIFNEHNNYFSKIYGISSSQVEKSLQKLIAYDLISYLDENGKVALRNKRLTENEFQKLKKINPEYNLLIGDSFINNNRELIANPSNYLTGWGRITVGVGIDNEEEKERKKEKKLKKIQEQNTIRLINILELSNIIEINEIKNLNDKEYRANHSSQFDAIIKLLDIFEVSLFDVIRKIDSEN